MNNIYNMLVETVKNAQSLITYGDMDDLDNLCRIEKYIQFIDSVAAVVPHIERTNIPDYTVGEVMNEMSAGRSVIDTIIGNGKLRGYKLGGQWRVPHVEVQAYKVRNQAHAVKSGNLPRRASLGVTLY